MKKVKLIVSLSIAIGLTWFLDKGTASLPPFGKLLNPYSGFWQNAEKPYTFDGNEKLDLDGLQGEVSILFDDNRVPHIFAENEHDLYFAQGYVQARDRLWQMDFVTRSAAGRLSEVVGEKALELDRYKKRMGSVYAAERCVETMMKNPQIKVAAEAYSEGINAYIKQLSPNQYPLEYKILNYAPEEWSPLKCALLLKEMSFTLASDTDDLRMTNVMNRLGKEAVDGLFPDYPYLESPIIPSGTKWDFKPLPVPAVPTQTTAEHPKDVTVAIAPQRNPSIGSNNWAVHGSRTASQLPILAGDPHLGLSLPSIWYQVQLHTPTLNVYGVTLPGSPGIIIGFNEHIAWSVTNVGSDVVDWYEVKFKDATRNEYWHDGKWKKTIKRIEEIKVKGQKTVIDTIVYTHHGPVVYEEGEKPFKPTVPVGHALRWIAHEESNDLMTFYSLNRAKNYDDYVQALSYYSCPAQNFVFASDQNDVAMWVNGRFPLKWKEQGKYVLDGSNPAHDWQGWIPHAHNPHVKNPARGFVSSANQFSVDAREYPYYLHWQYTTANRGRRINERLNQMKGATPDSLRLLQYDNLNIDARTFLPTLLKKADLGKLGKIYQPAIQTLVTWKYQNNIEEIGATIFEAWMTNIREHIWKDELPLTDSLPLRYPSEYKTMQMIEKEPMARWYDDISTTNKVETATDILQRSFQATIDTLVKNRGILSKNWEWATYKNTTVSHLVPMFKSFSREGIQVGGGSRIVNATARNWGPSWRFVVALGKTGPKAYGLYPGGQSGNPGSPFYDNMIQKWSKGELFELLYLRAKNEKTNRITASLIIK